MNLQSDGRAVEGIVVRVNRKTLSIYTDHNHWNIHPKFSTKVSGDASRLPQDIKDLMGGQN
jgi:hypothetical protein